MRTCNQLFFFAFLIDAPIRYIRGTVNERLMCVFVMFR